MPKPRGGRGCKAPYATHQVRIPDPITTQVHGLIERYQDYLASGGNPEEPPLLLDQAKPVDKFKSKRSKAIKLLDEALRLKANAGGAIKKEIEKALQLLKD